MKKLEFKNPRQRQWAISGAIVGIAVLTSVSIFATGPSAEPTADAEKAWPVSVTTAQPAALRPNFSAFGKLESNRIAKLRSDLVAPVREVHVKEGDWVEAGEVLIQLDDREARLRVLEREAELKQNAANLASSRSQYELEQESAAHFQSRYEVAQAKLQRHLDLMEKRLISKGLLDEVTSQANQASIEYRNHIRELTNLPNQIAAHEANVAKAQALLEQAEIDLEKTTIRAPFAGPVLGVFAAPGDHSNLSMALVQVADAAGFELRVQVPDTYARQFQNASDHQQLITAEDDTGARLVLNRLAAHVRTGQTGLDAFFAYADYQNHLPALGRMINVSIELPLQNDLIALPVQSIYENNRVYAVEGSRLVGHKVERVGERESAEHGYQVLIRTSDITPGSSIITTQLPKAITGLLVEVASDLQSGA